MQFCVVRYIINFYLMAFHFYIDKKNIVTQLSSVINIFKVFEVNYSSQNLSNRRMIVSSLLSFFIKFT